MKTAPESKLNTTQTFHIGIVCANFNPEITGEMLKTAHQIASSENLLIESKLEVPGSLEIPLATKWLLENKKIQGVITLGAIIKGSTDHDQVIAYGIVDNLLNLANQFNKPIGMGISGPGQTREQAKERASEYARRAVLAVKDMLILQSKQKQN